MSLEQDLPLITIHLGLLAHFKNTLILKQLFDECSLEVEVVDVVVAELEEKGQFLACFSLEHLVDCRREARLLQNNDGQYVSCAGEMVAWGVDEHVFEQEAQALGRPRDFGDLEFELLDLVNLSF